MKESDDLMIANFVYILTRYSKLKIVAKPQESRFQTISLTSPKWSKLAPGLKESRMILWLRGMPVTSLPKMVTQKKEQIAFAQSYFAIQTRKQELLEERIQLMERLQAREKLAATETELSKNIYEHGVTKVLLIYAVKATGRCLVETILLQ